MDMQPVQIEQVRRCAYRAKGCKVCGLGKHHATHKSGGDCPGYRGQRGCARCGANKTDLVHFGAPPSLNTLTSGMGSGNAMVYAGLKKTWQALFYTRLKESDLPKGLHRVYVEGEITFPDHREDRDQGNYRVLVEKALGDALESGGWIPSDSWDHYEFGGLQKREVPGESATRLMLFPTGTPPPVQFERSGEQMEMNT